MIKKLWIKNSEGFMNKFYLGFEKGITDMNLSIEKKIAKFQKN